MIFCDCGFKTESVGTLRRHHAANHGDSISFFETFKEEILANWDSFPGRGRRPFLLWLSDYRCSLCGYNKTRECGATILEIDHIDGNHDNNSFNNLQVVCPNCHALTPKYRNWSNKGNKKTASAVRPGNLGYAERVETRKAERIKTYENRKEKRNVTSAYKELEKIKIEFQQDFVERVSHLYESGEIDFSKYGWVQVLADELDEQPQVLGRRVRTLMPDFYAKHCFSRRYNHYVKKKIEKSQKNLNQK